MKNAVFILVLIFFSCKNENQVIFEDNFESNEINLKYWNFELGNGCPNLCGWGNNEKQFYTKQNASIKNGKLVIKATKNDSNYYASKLTTKNKIEFQYGSVEVRAKLPQGKGLWPAIWMLGSDIDSKTWPACGEIDIMEYVGKTPHKIHTTLHTPDSFGNSKNTKITTIENIENGFHTYKINWTKNDITFFIDDKEVYVFAPKEKNDKTWPFNKPFYIILNLAIGGNFGGPEIDNSIFPQEFIIDYVRVVKLK